MMMLWAKRLKRNGEDPSSFWALPFGDLMSLLLVVFVMIAAMSDIRAGDRFDRVGQSVKGAFGFHAAAQGHEAAAVTRLTGRSLLERMAAGTTGSARFQLPGAGAEALPACEMIMDGDRILIRLPEADVFIGLTARPTENTRKLVAAIADHLREGQAWLEVRGYGPASALSNETPYRDGLDVAAERARLVIRELTRAGVAENRLSAAALAHPAGEWSVEIVVHAAPAAISR